MLPCLGFGPLDVDRQGLEFLEVFAGQAWFGVQRFSLKIIGYRFRDGLPDPLNPKP